MGLVFTTDPHLSHPRIPLEPLAMRMMSRLALAFSLCLTFTLVARSEVVYDEASMGDLSDESLFPTDLQFFVPGADGRVKANSVLGRTDTQAADIFTFEIAEGHRLESLTLANYELGDNAMFVAIASGDTFPNEHFEINDPFFFDTSAWLGGRAVGVDQEGQDILGLLGDSAVTQVGSGFTPPLGAGKYTFYMQQTGPQNLYTLDFNVSAVPEPSTTLALCAMMAGGAGYRRLRYRRLRRKQRSGDDTNSPSLSV